MWRDTIVEEVHRFRDEQAKQFDNDLHAICEDIRKKQAASGRNPVTRPPRKSAVHDDA
jgi:hypothetical protein